MTVPTLGLSAERLREVFEYNRETGWFIRLIATGSRGIVGARAGNLDKSTGYRAIGLNGNSYLEHRLVWLYVYRILPPIEIDHINMDRTDNRICNLRLASRSQNGANARARSSNKLRIKGVCWHPRNKKFMARIMKDRQTILLGFFEAAEEAGAAYAEAAVRIFGEFARIA